MKKSFRILMAAILISVAGIQSCTKDSKEDLAYNIASSYLNHGKWKVSKFVESGNDETNHFSAYVFQFNTDGTVTATSGSNTVKGTWDTFTENSATKLSLNFNTAPFNELNDDWIIKSGSTSSIQLQHTSGGDGSIDYLNFDKI
jgi:hypothetical protein